MRRSISGDSPNQDEIMSATIAAACSAERLDAIAQRIRSRTWGRIERLEVEATASGIVVRGSAQSYYDKQLAIQALLDLLGGTQATPFSLNIHVSDKQQRRVITNY
jgi:hypothetical protein